MTAEAGTGRDAPLSASEKGWAFVYLGSLMAALGFMIASLFALSGPYLYISAAFMVVYVIAKWRIRLFDQARDPEKAKRWTLSVYLVFLAVVLYPVIAGVLMLAFVIAALVKNESVLPALGHGALAGLVLVLGIGVLTILGRIARALFCKEASPPPPPPIP